MKAQDNNHRANNAGGPPINSSQTAPTLTTLTQSDHEIIRTFLSNVPAGFPLSPGAALAELTGFAPLSPGLAGLAVAPSAHGYHMSPSRFDPGFPPYTADLPSVNTGLTAASSFKSGRGLNSPLRVESPLRHSIDGSALKKFDHLTSYSPHRRSPSPTRGYQSPFRLSHSNHVYAPILPSRAFNYATPAPSPPHPTEEPVPDFKMDSQTDRGVEVESEKSKPEKAKNVVNKIAFRKCRRKLKHKRITKQTESITEKKIENRLDTKKTGSNSELVALEKSSKEVDERLKAGCTCGQSCLQNLNPESVYRHRENISKLTKAEHDMYMMGMMMGTMADPLHTHKNKERKRKKNNYVYQGSEVCREAYVYLENVSIYQLKLIRKHVTENGVVPRIHKNTDRKPAHALTLEHTQEAHIFLQEFLASENSGRKKGLCDLTLKYLHLKYRSHYSDTGKRTMAYTTFRKFVNQRFPLIKFKNESFDVSIKRSALKNKIQSGKDGVPLPTNLTQTAAKKSDTHLGSVSLKS